MMFRRRGGSRWRWVGKLGDGAEAGRLAFQDLGRLRGRGGGEGGLSFGTDGTGALKPAACIPEAARI